MNKKRRYELDWLRVIAFGILIYFHAAIIFVPGGLPLIQNQDTSAIADLLVSISHQFRLSLLFLISGAGVGFAIQRRSPRSFIKERSGRLLIPLALGIFILIPITVYYERLHLNQFSGNFLLFYPQFFIHGVYPTGNLSWHHFWFIAYLYLFCLIGLKLFYFLNSDGGQTVLSRISQKLEGLGLYSFIVVLLMVEIPLRGIFPGFRDLIHDWASFSHWFLLFMVGFVIAKRQDLLDLICLYRNKSIALAIISTTILFYCFYHDGKLGLSGDENYLVIRYLVFCILRMTMVWSCLMSCLGLATHHLNFNHPILIYLNEAIYPLFILHLTITVIAGYYITPLDMGIWSKYILITSTTLVVGLFLFQYAIKPFNAMRLLFGMKPNTQNNKHVPTKLAVN